MKKSIAALLDGIVDYAGLFPPAKLDMAQTVANYASYSSGESAWALGRLVVPVSRLGELVEVSATLAGGPDKEPWRLSALVGEDYRSDAARIAAFNAGRGGRGRTMVVDAVEVHPPGPDAIAGAPDVLAEDRASGDDTSAGVNDGRSEAMAAIRAAFPRDITVFFEIPLGDDLERYAASVAACGGMAKARTGGVKSEMVPTTRDVARFLDCCRQHSLAFKLTSGLHHPIRSEYKLTYEPESPTGTMHGFLNVFLAAGFVLAGLNKEQTVAILEQRSADAFEFGEGDVRWGYHVLSVDDLRMARSRFALGFGSCSFEEPIDELKGLELL